MTTLRLIAGGPCRVGDCPTVYETDDYEELLVQGWGIDKPETMQALHLPTGEFAVRVPKDVILQAAEQIKAQEKQ